MVLLIFRKNSPDRKSIENVFLPLQKITSLRTIILPTDLKSVKDFFELMALSLRVKEKIVHITGDVHYMATFLFWKKVVLTIHDCNHYEKLSGLRKFLMGFIWYRLPILCSNRIILISPAAKDQLLKHFKVKEAKLDIIPNSFIPVEKYIASKANSEFTILSIGSLELKNRKRLIQAVSELENCKIIFVGRLSNELEKSLRSYQINYTQRFDIDRKDLEKAYCESDLLFFASGSRIDHVAIYLGRGRFVHAPSTGRNVSYGSMDDDWYSKNFVRAGRPRY